MSVITCRRNSHSILVSFTSDATVRSVSKIKNGLTRILSEPVDLYRLDLSAVEETDFTFIQLLISYSFKLKSLNRELVLVNCSDDSSFSRTASLCGIDIRSILKFEGDGHGY